MNPLYNTNDSPNNATQPTKAVNRQGVAVPRTHNTFDLSYNNYTTQLYGYYYPFYCFHGVPGDSVPLRSEVDIRSFAMKSPYLGGLTLNKDYYLCPYQAILPNTWELIYKNPSQGDDVPDDANCLIPADAPRAILDALVQKLIVDPADNPTGDNVASYVRALFYSECFFGQGSLLFNLGYKSCPQFYLQNKADLTFSFDTLFDSYMRYLLGVGTIFSITLSDGTSQSFLISSKDNFYGNGTTIRVSLNTAVSILRENPNFVITRSISVGDVTDDIMRGIFAESANLSLSSFLSPKKDINVSSILAYQTIWSQFFVNPQVDYIYNCDIYRETFRSNFINKYGSETWYTVPWQTFEYNGSHITYDYFSKHYFEKIFSRTPNFNDYDIVHYLFGLRQSLRFGDYFTDCRTKPYAPGVMDAPVVGEKVSAIDITKSVVMQRYLNAVVKLGNNFGDYLRGIFGTTPSPDYHFPKFIAHSEVSVDGFEVANTSDSSQGKLVTNLKTSADKYEFQVEVDMPCIILGISSFSVPRVYSQTHNRFFFHNDRFDMFNPMLQYIGDQEVNTFELRNSALNGETGDTPFGYSSRNAEYKQTFSVASGGFIEMLPSWAFLSDSLFQGYFVPDTLIPQSPEFIRAKDYEFDRFFEVQTGLSLGHKFHFILRYNNQNVCNRPMEVNPGIL